MTKKKFFILLISVFSICVVFYIVFLLFTGLFPRHELLRVVTRSLDEKELGKIEYWSVQKRGYENDINRTIFDSKVRIPEFVPEISEFADYSEYQVDFDSDIRTKSTLNLRGSDEADELRKTFAKVFKCARKEIPHDVYRIRCFIPDGVYMYITTDLNANWSDPVGLYQYNIETGEFVYLAGWDDVEILGITVVP